MTILYDHMSELKSFVTMRNMNLHPMILARLLRKADMKNKQRHYTLGHWMLKYQKGQSENNCFLAPSRTNTLLLLLIVTYISELNDGSGFKILDVVTIYLSILKTDKWKMLFF